MDDGCLRQADLWCCFSLSRKAPRLRRGDDGSDHSNVEQLCS
jgi:hypothetical protein